MTIVFVGFRESHGCEATLHERNMIAAAQITIATIDHHHTHSRHVALARFLYEARQLPRGRIILTTNAATHRRLLGFLAGGYTFRENAHRSSISNSIAAERAA